MREKFIMVIFHFILKVTLKMATPQRRGKAQEKFEKHIKQFVFYPNKGFFTSACLTVAKAIEDICARFPNLREIISTYCSVREASLELIKDLSVRGILETFGSPIPLQIPKSTVASPERFNCQILGTIFSRNPNLELYLEYERMNETMGKKFDSKDMPITCLKIGNEVFVLLEGQHRLIQEEVLLYNISLKIE
jgi:hypothetical protein